MPDVVVAIGQLALEDVEAGPRVHRGGDPDHPVVAAALVHERVAEHLRVLRRSGLARSRACGPGAAGAPWAIDLGLAACHFSIPSRPPSSAGREPLALDRGAVDDHGTLGGERLTKRAAQRAHVVAVDHAHVGEVELLPPQPGRPERLDRLLDVRAEPLERGAEPGGQLGQAVLDVLASVPELRVQADAVEVAGEGADVGCDRHAVVVEQDDDRGPVAPGLVDRLERDAAGHRPVSDHGDDLSVLAVTGAHRLLDSHGVADRGGGVPRAHDVVARLVNGAERRQALVAPDRLQLIAATGQDLVRIGLVAHVPEDLVARRVQQRVQRDGDLARPEVGAEVATDLPHRVDDVGADLLGQRLQLVVVETVQVLGLVDSVEELGHQKVRVAMKSVICSSSAASMGPDWARAARARCVRLARQPARPVQTELGDVGALAQPLVAALGLAERLLRSSHVKNVIHDLEKDAQLAGEGAQSGDCGRFGRAVEEQNALDASGDQAPGLELVQPPQPGDAVGSGRRHVDVLAAHHALNPRGGGQLARRRRGAAAHRPPGARAAARMPRRTARRPPGSRRPRRTCGGRWAVPGAGRRRPSPAGRRGSASRCG